MTRRRPDGIDKGVVEHRITLGDLERRELRKMIDRESLRKDIATGRDIAQTVVVAGGLVGAGYMGYKLYNVLIQYLAEVFEIIPDIPPEILAVARESGISAINLAFPATWQGPLWWRARRDAWAKQTGESLGLR
jgi:hypothetical protein